MAVLVLSPRYSIDSRRLAAAARGLGWEVRRLVGREVPRDVAREEVVLYGENFFVEYMAQALGIGLVRPAAGFLGEVAEKWVKRKVEVITVSAFKGVERPTFIKAADFKAFAARVYEPGEVIPGLETLAGDTRLLLSEPVEWEIEYRFFIGEGRVRGMSPYLVGGEVAQDAAQDAGGMWVAEGEVVAEAMEMVAGVLADEAVALPKGVVMDVGRMAGRGWGIVELNPAWSAGIYGCDPAGVLAVVAKSMGG